MEKEKKQTEREVLKQLSKKGKYTLVRIKGKGYFEKIK